MTCSADISGEPGMPTVPAFIYGTLKRGHAAHRLLGSARFLDTAEAVDPVTMVDCGGYPGLLRGGAARVQGELYHIPPRLWPRLDDYENVTGGDYSRQVIRVRRSRDQAVVTAMTYILSPAVSHRGAVGSTWPHELDHPGLATWASD